MEDLRKALEEGLKGFEVTLIDRVGEVAVEVISEVFPNNPRLFAIVLYKPLQPWYADKVISFAKRHLVPLLKGAKP